MSSNTVKPTGVKPPPSKRQKIGFKTNYRLMQSKSIAECAKGSILQYVLTFIKLPFVIKIFVLSIFEGPFNTGFTVQKHMRPSQTQIRMDISKGRSESLPSA